MLPNLVIYVLHLISYLYIAVSGGPDGPKFRPACCLGLMAHEPDGSTADAV
jgi:hypothetical protein